MRVFSFGGGVQSTAALVLAAQGRIDYKEFYFANVGNDSENPDTLDYIHNYAMNFAHDNGLKLWELFKIGRDKQVKTLHQRIMANNRTIPIPARLQNGAPGNRTCIVDFKIRIIDKAVKDAGHERYTVGIGFSLDEMHRCRTIEWEETYNGIWKIQEYPLIDLRLNRNACSKIIQDAGLPVPPKSSCYFCPFHSPTEWMRIKRETPDLFAKAVEVEKRLKAKRRTLGKDEIWLHPALVPLEQAVAQMVFDFDEKENCESGYCMV